MSRILIFSDIHSDLNALRRLMDVDADYYVAAGDLVSWAKGLDRVGEVLSRRADRTFVLPGNHESEADIAGLCERHGLRNLHGVSVEIDGVHVAGLGYSNPTPFDTPGEYSESEIGDRLARFRGLRPLVLVCHCPPRNTPLDDAGGGRHFGSESVRAFIEKEEPSYFFCGHIHEAEGVEAALGRTAGVNVGKRGYLLDLARVNGGI